MLSERGYLSLDKCLGSMLESVPENIGNGTKRLGLKFSSVTFSGK
jgi:hypothetical protein